MSTLRELLELCQASEGVLEAFEVDIWNTVEEEEEEEDQEGEDNEKVTDSSRVK